MRNHPAESGDRAAFFSLPWDEQARQIRRWECDTVRAFSDGVRRADIMVFGKTVEIVAYHGLWPRLVRSIKGMDPPDKFRRQCLVSWIRWGDGFRSEVNDDLLLMDLLRVVLPKYEGRAIRLYRGDSFGNRRCRTYGLSWSSDREVARSFADGMWCTSKGGSCLLETVAPSAAIICAPGRIDNSYGEDEYIVDRRRLERVVVCERFAQLTYEEFRRHAPPTVDDDGVLRSADVPLDGVGGTEKPLRP
jgi:hypothetical protein